MVKTNISFYEKKKEITTKTLTLHERQGSHYGKVLVLNFLEMGNTVFFWFKKVYGRYFIQYGIPCVLSTKNFLFWAF